MSRGSGSLADFKAKFTSVRPNRFRIDFPQSWESKLYKHTWIPADKASDIFIYCRSAILPASKLGTLQVSYLGRIYYDSGDREFDTLTLSFYNSQDFALRNFFEEWLNNINQLNENYQLSSSSTTSTSNTKNPFDIFMDDLKITQLDRRDLPIKTYNFYGVFPIECSEIRLDYSDNNTVETFDVTFQYQWWETTLKKE